MRERTESELLELLVEEARAKSERERIPEDWEETLARVRAEHVERANVGPRGFGSRPRARAAHRLPGFPHRRLLDGLRFDGLDGVDL